VFGKLYNFECVVAICYIVPFGTSYVAVS